MRGQSGRRRFPERFCQAGDLAAQDFFPPARWPYRRWPPGVSGHSPSISWAWSPSSRRAPQNTTMVLPGCQGGDGFPCRHWGAPRHPGDDDALAHTGEGVLCPKAAAAPAEAGSPGQTAQGMPRASKASICSRMAPLRGKGSPVWEADGGFALPFPLVEGSKGPPPKSFWRCCTGAPYWVSSRSSGLIRLPA